MSFHKASLILESGKSAAFMLHRVNIDFLPFSYDPYSSYFFPPYSSHFGHNGSTTRRILRDTKGFTFHLTQSGCGKKNRKKNDKMCF